MRGGIPHRRAAVKVHGLWQTEIAVGVVIAAFLVVDGLGRGLGVLAVVLVSPATVGFDDTAPVKLDPLLFDDVAVVPGDGGLYHLVILPEDWEVGGLDRDVFTEVDQRPQGRIGRLGGRLLGLLSILVERLGPTIDVCVGVHLGAELVEVLEGSGGHFRFLLR